MELSVVRPLSRNWGWLMVRGILGILFGLVALFSPLATMTALIMIFGAYLLLDAMALLAAASAAAREHHATRLLLADGLLTLLAGVFSLIFPMVAAVAIIILWAAWAIVTGAFEMVAGMHLHRNVGNNYFLMAAGVVSVLFGLTLLVVPSAGLVVLSWCVGLYALFFGLSITALAWRVHSLDLSPSRVPESRVRSSPVQPSIDDAVLDREPIPRRDEW